MSDVKMLVQHSLEEQVGYNPGVNLLVAVAAFEFLSVPDLT